MGDLLDWAEQYVRHRDIFEKRIASLEKKEDRLLIKNKDGSTVLVLAPDSLSDETLKKAGSAEKSLVVTRNLRANLDFLVKRWEAFAALRGLKMVFANTKAHEKWVLVPHSHHAVADPESLELGLTAMFEAVPKG